MAAPRGTSVRHVARDPWLSIRGPGVRRRCSGASFGVCGGGGGSGGGGGGGREPVGDPEAQSICCFFWGGVHEGVRGGEPEARFQIGGGPLADKRCKCLGTSMCTALLKGRRTDVSGSFVLPHVFAGNHFRRLRGLGALTPGPSLTRAAANRGRGGGGGLSPGGGRLQLVLMRHPPRAMSKLAGGGGGGWAARNPLLSHAYLKGVSGGMGI